MNSYANDFTKTVQTYYKDLKKYNPIPKDKELDLIKQAKKNNLLAQNTILSSNLKFVFDIAKKYKGKGVAMEDLIAEGNIGLVKALDKFDTSKNVKFISYAVWWVRQSMKEVIKKRQQQTTIEQNKNDITNKVNQVEQNVNTNSSGITDLNNKYNQQQTLINTNKTNIETNKNTINNVNQNLTSTQNLLTQTINELRTLRPFKYVGAYTSSKAYMINEMVSLNNAFYLSVEDNNSTTPSTSNNKWIVMENFQQVDLTNYATKLEVNNAKTDLQNKITTNTSDIAYLQKNTVNTTTDQTINGIKTFAYQIKANGGITNLIDPTNDTDAVNKLYVDNNSLSKTATAFQTVNSSVSFLRPITVQTPTGNNDAANKQYVDNKTTNSVLYRQVYFSSTVYSTDQTTTISISNYVNSNSAAFQSWMIQFDRQGNNGNTYEGTFNLNFILPDINKATWVEANTYFNSSNQRFQDGGRAGITIYRVNSNQLKLTFQLWSGNNRIKNVKLYAPR